MSKDLTAKLLANENITVTTGPVRTASFDIKNRVLSLPQWKDISNDVLDLLIGHEVGHALWTTTDFWTDELKAMPHMQGYLNVIEDVRIEKLIKRKYPGLRKAFRVGYDELRNNDFFELQGKDLKDMLLIDRINLFYKAGYKSGVKFNREESNFVRRAEYTNTVQDVISLAKDIYEFTKKELQNKIDELKNADPHELEMEEDDSIDLMEDISGDASEDSEMPEDLNSDSGSSEYGSAKPEDMMESKTEKSLAKHLEDLADTKKATKYYVIPKEIKQDQIFVGYKTVIELLKKPINPCNYYSPSKDPERVAKFKTKFLQESKKTVQYLVKEFEMKKAASRYKRTQQAKSGSLDMRKLYQYKLNDDIFKRLNIIPDDKNHGMIMLVDWSASMQFNIEQTLQQVVNLSMFCRAIQIPFSVQALSTEFQRRYVDENSEWQTRDRIELENLLKPNEINVYSDLSLFELFNSKMTTAEFNYVVDQVITGDIFGKGRDFELGGTPLNEALAYMTKYVPEFKAKHNVEKISFITLTDGEGVGLRDCANFSLNRGRQFIDNEWQESQSYLHDEKTKKNYKLGISSTHTRALLDIIRNSCNATIIGFYIFKLTENNLHTAYHNNTPTDNRNGNGYWSIRDYLKSQIRKDAYVELPNSGYDALFLVPTRSLEISIDEQLEINADMSASKIANQLKKLFTSKKKSRFLLNTFIEMIA